LYDALIAKELVTCRFAGFRLAFKVFDFVIAFTVFSFVTRIVVAEIAIAAGFAA
jgi:hypothetical protein